MVIAKTCTIEDCYSPHEAKGYCKTHYHRNLKTGSPHKKPRRPNALRVLTCSQCGNGYETTSNNSKFCSSKCRERDRYLRSREKRINAARSYRTTNRDEICKRRREMYLENIEKRRAENRKNYLKHRDARIRAAIEYQSSHPEVVALTRARRRAATKYKITVKDHKKLLHLHRGCCAYCHTQLEEWGRKSGNSLQWDHVVPLSRGGYDGIGNLVPSCRDCNLGKNKSTVMEWELRKKAQWYVQREIDRVENDG